MFDLAAETSSFQNLQHIYGRTRISWKCDSGVVQFLYFGLGSTASRPVADGHCSILSGGVALDRSSRLAHPPLVDSGCSDVQTQRLNMCGCFRVADPKQVAEYFGVDECLETNPITLHMRSGERSYNVKFAYLLTNGAGAMR